MNYIYQLEKHIEQLTETLMLYAKEIDRLRAENEQLQKAG